MYSTSYIKCFICHAYQIVIKIECDRYFAGTKLNLITCRSRFLPTKMAV